MGNKRMIINWILLIVMDVINIFNDYGYEVLIKFTRREKHATEIVKALGSQVDMIACMGGDGTLNEVWRECVQPDLKNR